MNLGALASYLWLNQSFFALLNLYGRDSEIFDMIKNGNIAYELTRPKNLYFMWYFKILGQRLANVSLRCVPVIVISLLLPKPYNLSLPVSFEALIISIIGLLIGSLLICAIINMYHVITLSTLNEKGIANIFISVADLLSGLVVPIPFFPNWLQTVSNYLPFRYVSDLPFRVYSGDVSIENGLFGILIQFFWIFIIIMIGYLLVKKSLKKVVVQGG